MQVGTGRSILNGIAIGKLKIYKKKDTVISTAEIADTAAEVARFEAAQQKAIEQQTALYEKALAEAGEDIAEVFNIHAMMLEDDDFVDPIKEIINGQHKCAEYAVKTAGDNQAAVFAAMDDPYLQARSADVIDIAQAILDILQGVDNASLQGTEPSILVAEDLAPSETVRMDKSLLLGFIPREGSSNSHTAILARSMNIPALIQCKDIQDDWAIQMLCLAEIAVRILRSGKHKNAFLCNDPAVVAGYYMPSMRFLETEQVRLLILDGKNALEKEMILSTGSFTASMAAPREVFYYALKHKAVSIILLHNHPSGDPSPSKDDLVLTKRMADTGSMIGIPLLDHIVIGDNRYISLRESGYLS